MSTPTATDPLVAILLEAVDDAIEYRASDMGFCADCLKRAGSGPCLDHQADDRLVADYERLRARVAAGEIAVIRDIAAPGSAARGGNQ